MRKFFLLSYDAKTDLQTVTAEYDVGHFDSTRLLRCKPVPDNYLENVRLRLIKGRHSDYVANPESWPIVSPEMLSYFENFGAQIQALQARLLDERGREILSNYSVLNLLKCLHGAVDLAKSKTSHMTILGETIVTVSEFVFRRDVVPGNVHVFKVKESIDDIVVSADFAREVRTAKLEGCVFLPTRTV